MDFFILLADNRRKCCKPYILAAYYLYMHFSCPRAIKLTEINSLPGAENKPSVLDNHLLGKSEKACFYMSCRISLHMSISIIKRNYFVDFLRYIGYNIRIGILVNCYRSSGMRNKNRANPRSYSRIAYCFLKP